MDEAAKLVERDEGVASGGWFGTLFFLCLVAFAAFGATTLPPDHKIRGALPFDFPVTDVAETKAHFVATIDHLLATAKYRTPAAEAPVVEEVDSSDLPSAQDVAEAYDAASVLGVLRKHQKKTAAAFSALALMPLYHKLAGPN